MAVVLFPCDPLSPRAVEPDFEGEHAAARAAGFEVGLIDHERLTRGEPEAAVARVPHGPPVAVYRGWMLTPPSYSALHAALASRGMALINSPAAYETCHYLPAGYRYIEGHTPTSVWLELRGEVDFERVHAALAAFGDSSAIVKDYVKSQKHYWNEACFIPCASDRAHVERVVRRFLELQGEDLNVGLVFRQLAPLRIVGKHPRSGMPLAAELRTFWLDGEPILQHRYWGDLTTFDAELPLAELREVMAPVPSRFFSADIAFLQDSGWTIVELGDGQVTGLPAPELAVRFYASIAQSLLG